MSAEEERVQERNQLLAIALERGANLLYMEGEKMIWRDDRTYNTYVACDFDNRDVSALDQLKAAIAQRDADLQRMTQEKLARQDLDSRRAMVPLTYEDLHRFFGMPDNMDVVGFHADPETQAIMLHVRSSELDRVHPGARMPILEGGWHREIRRVAQDESDESSIIGQWIDDGTHSPYQIYVRFEWTPQ